MAGAWGLPRAWGAAAALTVVGVVGLRWGRRWRAVLTISGFVLMLALTRGGEAGAMSVAGSAAVSGTVWPRWIWFVLLGIVLVLYPRRAWRDAPFFPTPPRALRPLAGRIDLPPDARVLDAGCGAGDGLRALLDAWPHTQVEGIECSPALAWAARVRCPRATVLHADLWQHDWHAYQLVYVFQRPESMPDLWVKAQREMQPGTWFVSLDFDVPGQTATEIVQANRGRTLRAWRIHGPSSQCVTAKADNPR